MAVHRPAAAASIQPLAQELPYAAGAAVKRKKIRKSGFSSCSQTCVGFSYCVFIECLQVGVLGGKESNIDTTAPAIIIT